MSFRNKPSIFKRELDNRLQPRLKPRIRRGHTTDLGKPRLPSLFYFEQLSHCRNLAQLLLRLHQLGHFQFSSTHMRHFFFKGSSLKVFFKDSLKVSWVFWPFALLPKEASGVWGNCSYHTHKITLLCSDDAPLEQWSGFRMTEYGWSRTNQRNAKTSMSVVSSGSYKAGVCSC